MNIQINTIRNSTPPKFNGTITAMAKKKTANSVS